MLDKLNYLKNFNPSGMIINHRNICYKKKTDSLCEKTSQKLKGILFWFNFELFPGKKAQDWGDRSDDNQLPIYIHSWVWQNSLPFGGKLNLVKKDSRLSIVYRRTSSVMDFSFYFYIFNIPVLVGLNSKHTGILL